jgi:hypothetical protein
MQNPKFVTYNKSMFYSPPSHSLLSPKPPKTLQKRESFSTIPSPLLQAFPMPPSKETSMDKSILSALKDQSLSISISHSIPKTTESPIPKSNSTSPKLKHIAKGNASIKKTDELLAKITSSVLSSTYTVRKKPKPASMTAYPTETSEKSLLSEGKLKRSNTSSKKSDFPNLESVLELKPLKSLEPEFSSSPLTIRKMKRLLNRKTSIVSNSTYSSTMSVSTLPNVL